MHFVKENPKAGHANCGITVAGWDILVGRLVCFWFCLTASGLLWVWPFIIAAILYFKHMSSTFVFILYLVYIVVGPGAKASRTCFWRTPLRRWSLWRLMALYFDARLVKTADLNPSGHYIFAVHPHGIIAISSWLNFVTEATGFSKIFPGIDLRAATLASNFRIPGVREYILLHGLVDADRETLRTMLIGPAGRSVLLTVGGAAEALLVSPGTYDVILRCRKGFVRLALETGAALVPVIAYGENDIFHTHIPPRGSWMAAGMRRFKRAFGVSSPIFWGTGFFGGWGMLPRQVQLTTVVGAPLAVAKTPSPTPDQIDRLHAAYVATLQQLWDNTYDKYGKGIKRGLTIVQ